MKAINENSGFLCETNTCERGIVYADDNYIEFGYFKPDGKEILINLEEYGSAIGISEEKLNKRFIYSNKYGKYIDKLNLTKIELLNNVLCKGNGNFPYNFDKKYEAVDNFNIFKGKQEVLNCFEYELSNHFNYTFGLEFETTQGYIPQHKCFRDGLIPLRDGSISGIEYSTVILQGNEGLNLLNQQLNTLKEYTYFDKECALHIHFGGFPVTDAAIWALYNVWYAVERELSNNGFIPPYSFMTSMYKRNKKDYCNLLPKADTFSELYEYLVERSYLGNLYQPHPRDPHKKGKWNIRSRYFGLNLINMLCYSNPKTVEFRFLRPTYNMNKIVLWLYILNAVLLYSEKISSNKVIGDNFRITNIIKFVYNEEIAEKILYGLELLRIEEYNQYCNNNCYGGNSNITEDLFDDSERIFW